MKSLEEFAAEALRRDPSLPAFEFGGRSYLSGELQALARRVSGMLAESGVPRDAPVAFVARNRPSAMTTLLALIERGQPIRMVFAFQSCAGVAAQLDRLQPAA